LKEKDHFNLEGITGDFSGFLSDYRVKNNLTLLELGDRIGVSTSFVFRLINGERKISMEFILKTLWRLNAPDEVIQEVLFSLLKKTDSIIEE